MCYIRIRNQVSDFFFLYKIGKINLKNVNKFIKNYVFYSRQEYQRLICWGGEKIILTHFLL